MNKLEKITVNSTVKRFFKHLSKRRKNQLIIVFILTILASFAEVLSLGAIIPFLGVLVSPEKVFAIPVLKPILSFFNILTPANLLLPFTILFIICVLLAGLMRLMLIYLNTRLAYAIGADFSLKIFRQTLYQPYSVHVASNSAEIISSLANKVNQAIAYFLNPILVVFSSFIILTSILVALLLVDPVMSLTAFLGFTIIYLAVIRLTRNQLSLYSQRTSLNYSLSIKLLQEGLGGIRDVLIDGLQETYANQYKEVDRALRHAQANGSIVGLSPRYLVESLGMVFIAILAYLMANKAGGLNNTISLLGALALGAQKMLPVMQQAFYAYTSIKTNLDSVNDIISLLEIPINKDMYENATQLPGFKKVIRVNNICFRYHLDAPMVLENLSFEIPFATRVGFIGATGSGKSTLLDILMGLLLPTSGEIYIDDTLLEAKNIRSWQKLIAHVPQSIYLADSSIAENIAFGTKKEEIDLDRVIEAAKLAQIYDFIESIPNKFNTFVGERGIRLSGGQRQRIGIARALYKKASVIIFDEATSALDNETEKSVMDAIDNLPGNITVLIIAHRLSTLKRCQLVIELKDGQLLRLTSGDMLN